MIDPEAVGRDGQFLAESSRWPSQSRRRQDHQQRYKSEERQQEVRQRIFERAVFALNRAAAGQNRELALEIVEENKKVRDQTTYRAGSKPWPGAIDVPKANGNQGESEDKRQ